MTDPGGHCQEKQDALTRGREPMSKMGKHEPVLKVKWHMADGRAGLGCGLMKCEGSGFIMWMCSVAQSCRTLCYAMDCSLPGSSVHRIVQAQILEWVAIFLLQGIFPTQGSNLHLLYLLCSRWTPYLLSPSCEWTNINSDTVHDSPGAWQSPSQWKLSF